MPDDAPAAEKEPDEKPATPETEPAPPAEKKAKPRRPPRRPRSRGTPAGQLARRKPPFLSDGTEPGSPRRARERRARSTCSLSGGSSAARRRSPAPLLGKLVGVHENSVANWERGTAITEKNAAKLREIASQAASGKLALLKTKRLGRPARKATAKKAASKTANADGAVNVSALRAKLGLSRVKFAKLSRLVGRLRRELGAREAAEPEVRGEAPRALEGREGREGLGADRAPRTPDPRRAGREGGSSLGLGQDRGRDRGGLRERRPGRALWRESEDQVRVPGAGGAGSEGGRGRGSGGRHRR